MRNLLVALCSALLLWASARGRRIVYNNPSTDAQREIAAECENNLPQQDKYTVTLFLYLVTDPASTDFTLLETNAPNADPYLEDCSTVSVSNSSNDTISNDTVRSILRMESGPNPTCHDVLFFVGAHPVVCGYDPIFAIPQIDYVPRTEQETVIQTNCLQNLPVPYGSRSTLVRYESNPAGAFPGYSRLIDTTLPDNGDPFREDCSAALGSRGGAGDETRPVLVLASGTCHDVLFFEGGTNPVVCLYLNSPRALLAPQGSRYAPSTSAETELSDECQKNLPAVDKFAVSLRMYDITDPQIRSALQQTDAPNTDRFVEDCDFSTFGVSGSSSENVRDLLYLKPTEPGKNVSCHDVLFLVNDTHPVICFYDAIVATGMVDYEPRNDEQRQIERDCKQNLPHPDNSRVSLVEYEADPEGAFPGYTLWNVPYPNTEDQFREDCPTLFQFIPNRSRPPYNETLNETRAVIIISQSSTCHDVLFFDDNSTNPVVCLFLTRPGVERVVPKNPAIVTLFLLCVSVIASFILLATHIIFPTLQTLPSKVIMNLATAFFVGDIFYIAQVSLFLDNPSARDVIDPVIIVAFYFFYARFVWMALAGFEMCRTIHVGTQLRFNSTSKRMKILLIYVITGWSLPLIPTIIMAIVHYEKLEEEGVGKQSLFGIGGSIITFVPVAIVMIFNVGIVAYLSYILYKARQWQIKVTEAIASHRRKTNFTRIFIIILSLLGVTWIVLFIIVIEGIQTTDAVQIIAAIFNTMQPIFVCVSFLGTKKIYHKYRNLCRGKSDEEVTETSAIQNRFRNRRLLSFLFTDKELADAVPKYRFGRSNRRDSKLSTTSMSMLTRDSTNSLPTPSNGVSTPPKEAPSLAPISEELEPEEVATDSPSHITVDLKDSSL